MKIVKATTDGTVMDGERIVDGGKLPILRGVDGVSV